MGSGKTTAMFNKMNEQLKDLSVKYIYVSPLLTEVGGWLDSKGIVQDGRIQKALPHQNFQAPVSTGDGKSENLIELARAGCNIACTHSCFHGLLNKDFEELKRLNYRIVIDESVDTYRTLSTNKDDLDAVLGSGVLTKGAKGELSWDVKKKPIENLVSKWQKEVAISCQTHDAWLINDAVILLELPLKLLSVFESVEVLTYQFKYTIMNAWCKANSVEIVISNELLDYGMRQENALKATIRDNLKLYKPKYISPAPLSYSWWSKVKPKDSKLDYLKKSVTSFMVQLCKKDGLSSDDVLITCPKAAWFLDMNNETGKGKAKGARYSQVEWASNSCRATNKYADKKAIVYLSNKALPPPLTKHLSDNDASIISRGYALSELLQFVWRGCIRDGKPMHLYVPNPRLLGDLEAWLAE